MHFFFSLTVYVVTQNILTKIDFISMLIATVKPMMIFQYFAPKQKRIFLQENYELSKILTEENQK